MISAEQVIITPFISSIQSPFLSPSASLSLPRLSLQQHLSCISMSTTGDTEAPLVPPAAPNREIILLVVGDNGVGKMQLVSKFLRENNVLDGQRDLVIGGQNVKARVVVVEDNRRPGVVKYNPYNKNAAGALLVYDVTNNQSFQNIGWWLEAVWGCRKNRRNFVIKLVGNRPRSRLSLQGTLSVMDAVEQGKVLAKREGLTFIETSDIEDVNVDQAFETILAEIMERADAGCAPNCNCINPHCAIM